MCRIWLWYVGDFVGDVEMVVSNLPSIRPVVAQQSFYFLSYTILLTFLGWDEATNQIRLVMSLHYKLGWQTSVEWSVHIQFPESLRIVESTVTDADASCDSQASHPCLVDPGQSTHRCRWGVVFPRPTQQGAATLGGWGRSSSEFTVEKKNCCAGPWSLVKSLASSQHIPALL